MNPMNKRNLAMEVKLVIFDCDGVLVDTEPLSNEILKNSLSKIGINLSIRQVREKFLGLSIEHIRTIIETENNITLDPNWCQDIRTETELAFIQQGVTAIPGIKSQVEKLKEKQIQYCVASSGRIEKMHVTLGQAGLLPLFKDVLFSASMVSRGKPFPDLFLHAANKMDVNVESCLVIEDSVNGVRAAKSAGMRVLGYAGDSQTDATELIANGAEIIWNMKEISGKLIPTAIV